MLCWIRYHLLAENSLRLARFKTFLEASKIISRSRFLRKATGTSRNPSGIPPVFHLVGVPTLATALAVMPPKPNQSSCSEKKAGALSMIVMLPSNPADYCPKMETVRIASQFEYLRNPIGFPTDLSSRLPRYYYLTLEISLLWPWGQSESAYGTSGSTTENIWLESLSSLVRMFSAVGIGYSLPVAGVSDSLLNNLKPSQKVDFISHVFAENGKVPARVVGNALERTH